MQALNEIEFQSAGSGEDVFEKYREVYVCIPRENNQIITQQENMAYNFSCPYLNGTIELTEERFQHIMTGHPELLPEYLAEIAETVTDPDRVCLSPRSSSALLFVRWFDSILDGKYIVVVVETGIEPVKRHWIVTAYITRKLAGGPIAWQKT